MKSLKEQLNQAINDSVSYRKLDGTDIEAVKRCLIDIYLHVKSICEANHLTLLLSGGSCLGAVRHNGFIPWDDDLDLMMPRYDYDRLLSLCESGALGDNYEYTFPSKDHDSPYAFLKVYLKDSRFVGVEGENEKYPNGIFIDIFPIEGAPESVLLRRAKGILANILRLCANMVNTSHKGDKFIASFYKQNRRLYVNMKCRLILGRMLSLISHVRWICWYDTVVKNGNIGKYAVIPTGRKLYIGETLPSAVFFPPSKGSFEGIEVDLPADSDAYLKNLYGDYWQIPPIEKRESHMIYELQLPQRYYEF